MSPNIKHEYPLKLVRKKKEAKDLYRLTFAVPQKMRRSFQKAGQYLSLKLQGDCGFYAMAHDPSPPEENPLSSEKTSEKKKKKEERWEFLIKRDKNAENGVSSALCALKENDLVFSSFVLGKGFALEESLEVFKKSEDLHLFAIGSAIAPLRSLLLYLLTCKRIQERQKTTKRALPKITLWQGVLSKEHLAYKKEYLDWRKKGVELKLCLHGMDGMDGASPDLDSASLFIGEDREDREEGMGANIEISNRNPIELLAEQKLDLSRSIVCWAGSKEFGQSLQELCLNLALPKKAFLDNLK